VLARFSFWIFGLAVLMVAIAPPTHAEPKRDALEKLGFTVITGFDLDQAEMRRTIGRFAQALEGAAVGVFYYAGHGMQLNGTNYLVPTDSRLENQYPPEFELVPFGLVQRVMEDDKKRTNILFLDACRDNPLARNLARAMGTRSASVQLGLSPTESGIGTLISFSTQPGNVALDGKGRNSPYAGALVKQLRQPSLPISDMLLNVRREVRLATQDRQITWEHSALSERFYFAPPKPVVVVPPAAKRKEEQAELARQINRELRRVGCDPNVTDGTWTATSQAALQRFAESTKLALHIDEPTKAALDAITSHKFIVCPRLPEVKPPPTEKPTEKPVVVAPPPTISAPSKIVEPAALARVAPPDRKKSEPEPIAAVPAPAPFPKAPTPPASATPPAATAPVPPAAVALPVPAVPPAEISPPVAEKPPNDAPRALPRAAKVKTSPQPPPAAAVQPAPFATSIQREEKCRLETERECRIRIGIEYSSTSVCPIAARKEICPGSRPAAARPPPARTVERDKQKIDREKKCRFDSAFTQRPSLSACD
jgi:hypothetical protein